MRNYEIFLINAEVAYIYYGFEAKLFNLFKEHHYASTPLKEITYRQINYIQKPYNHKELNEWLQDQLTNQDMYDQAENNHVVAPEDGSSQAKLTVMKDKLLLAATGTFEAETLFFDTLKTFDDFFLAVEYERERYGWLRPLRSLRIVEQG
ncbi:sporulation inhibitor of replication protein SirA [Alteribacter populi]|uniref:sporulation inhibitor of replication protein SirA n=1 Tax=Alteribacter populi TaxID=2011011 RepID=UPI000BBA5B28|nr:sporulation inhibitor of replication protein SirA [Alteribacter populi]